MTSERWKSQVRKDNRRLARAIDALHWDPINARKDPRIEHGRGRAGGGNLSLVQQEQFVGEGGGEVQVVAGREDRQVSLPRQRPQELPDLGLMMQVEKSIRLVQQERA